MTTAGNRTASVVAAIAVTALAAGLYVRRIEVPPMSAVELELAREAQLALVNGGRDADGRSYPVFWHGVDDRWLTPIPLYASAAARGMFGSEAAPRLAAASFAAVGVLLFYALVKRVFQSIGLALVAALLLLLTPAYATFARTAAHDGMWLVPIAAAWLLGLAAALARPTDQSAGPLLLCAAALAAGVYAQPSGALTVLVLAAVSAAALRPAGGTSVRAMSVAVAGAAVVIIPLVLWLARHPSAYADTLGAWLLHSTYIRSPLEWAFSLSNRLTLALVSKTYWDFYSPSHLLVNGSAPAMAGAFVLPVGVLVSIGVHGILRHDGVSPSHRFAPVALVAVVMSGPLAIAFNGPPTPQHAWAIVPFGVLCIAAGLVVVCVRDMFRRQDTNASRQLARIAVLGLVAVPLVAATFKEPRAMQRALVIVPLAVLLAASGIHSLWQSGRRGRVVAVLMVAAALAQSLAWYAGVTAR